MLLPTVFAIHLSSEIPVCFGFGHFRLRAYKVHILDCRGSRHWVSFPKAWAQANMAVMDDAAARLCPRCVIKLPHVVSSPSSLGHFSRGALSLRRVRRFSCEQPEC